MCGSIRDLANGLSYVAGVAVAAEGNRWFFEPGFDTVPAMSGISFMIDERGKRTAAVIDLRARMEIHGVTLARRLSMRRIIVR